MLNELMRRTRSFRRFQEEKRIAPEILSELIELAGLAGSARNLQPWRYMICRHKHHCRQIFPHLGWAGYLPEWPGPEQGERPAAYILCLLDTDICRNGDIDLGIASQNILLGAMAHGIGGCRIASISAALGQELQLPARLELQLVIALGYPAEEVIIVEPEERQDIRYWHGPAHDHYVPKRPLADILLPLPLS
ncbi:MAG: nitroreductase [Desulfobulbaceae bacterium]|nr:MAG: nitroreductase [Desulfobulbaceae bacterium]